MAEPLQPRRERMLRFLAQRAGTGEPPSVGEVAAEAGLRSSQTAYRHLKRLEEGSYPAQEGGQAKKIWLTETGREAAGREAAGRMALTGRIAAGCGLKAVATDEAYSLAFEFLTTRLVRRRYLLQVVGQSMVRARIEDSDLLVVEENEAPPDDAVVVASCGTGRRWP